MPDEDFVASVELTNTCNTFSKLGSQQTPSSPPKMPGSRTGNSCRVRSAPLPTLGRRFSLDHGSLDRFSDALLGWIADRCPEDGWQVLLAMAREPGAPPWLNQTALGLDDQVSHKILALALAHSIGLHEGIQDPPLPKCDDLECSLVLYRLGLVPPNGIQELARRLAIDAPLRQQGFLNVEESWGRRPRRQEPEPFSVGRFLRTKISLNIHALGKLVGTDAATMESKVESPLKDMALPQDVRQTVEGFLQNPPVGDKVFTILLKGPKGSGRCTLARSIADHLGLPLREISPYMDPRPGCCSLIDMNGSFDEDDFAKLQAQIGLLFLREEQGKGGFQADQCVDLVLDLGALTVAEMVHFCFKELRAAGPEFNEVDPFEIGQSGVAPGQLVTAIRRIKVKAKWRPSSPIEIKEQLAAAIKRYGNAQGGSGFAEIVQPKVGMQDLCLASEVQARFHRIVRNIRGRTKMLESWGIDTALTGKAKAICLFHGPSGTGKSMAAETLAGELGVPLWRIQASNLESAYVGASESKIHDFFLEAKAHGKDAVILLDEADSLLGDRSRAEGSTRRYQVSVTNAWLRELDQFEGILVFTTNHAAGLDPAIERRIQHRLEFPEPDAQVRGRIWANLFEKSSIPGSEALDLNEVAMRFPLSGGLIRNAFLECCHQAAESGLLTQEMLLKVCAEESQSRLRGKKGKQIRGFSMLREGEE